jgi:hypothetical protein
MIRPSPAYLVTGKTLWFREIGSSPDRSCPTGSRPVYRAVCAVAGDILWAAEGALFHSGRYGVSRGALTLADEDRTAAEEMLDALAQAKAFTRLDAAPSGGHPSCPAIFPPGHQSPERAQLSCEFETLMDATEEARLSAAEAGLEVSAHDMGATRSVGLSISDRAGSRLARVDWDTVGGLLSIRRGTDTPSFRALASAWAVSEDKDRIIVEATPEALAAVARHVMTEVNEIASVPSMSA